MHPSTSSHSCDVDGLPPSTAVVALPGVASASLLPVVIVVAALAVARTHSLFLLLLNCSSLLSSSFFELLQSFSLWLVL
jgi:hypothetical protein